MPKPSHIQVVVAEPGKPAEKRQVENTLEALQALVRGYIVLLRIREFPRLVFYVNEDKLDGLQPNIRVHGEEIVGPIVVTRVDGAGEDIGIDDTTAVGVSVWLDSTRSRQRLLTGVESPDEQAR